MARGTAYLVAVISPSLCGGCLVLATKEDIELLDTFFTELKESVRAKPYNIKLELPWQAKIITSMIKV